MSISDVTSRISQIQGQLALLGNAGTSGVSTVSGARSTATGTTSATGTSSATAFADSLAGASTVTVVEPGASASGEQVVAEAKKYLGLPYIWGGTDPTKGMDCSGLVQVVYGNLGYDLPRVSNQQAHAGRPVSDMSQAQPGDLLAWDNSSRNDGVDHIAIYAGDGKMIEAPRTGLDIRLVDVPSTPTVIRRILPDASSTGVASTSATAGATSRVPDSTPYAALFNSAAAAHGVDPALLAAVAKQESGYQADAVSPAGAQGLMQLMPATARGLGVTDSFDPAQAVDGAAKLLSDLLGRFGSTELALAGYNAGPGAVLRYGGVPPYPETRNYVSSIMSMLGAS